MNLQKLLLCASAECELFESFAFKQDDNKNKFLLGKAKASLARNFSWALSNKKGTVK